MRENRLYGSEGGGTELNQSPLPLSERATCLSSAFDPILCACHCGAWFGEGPANDSFSS